MPQYFSSLRSPRLSLVFTGAAGCFFGLPNFFFHIPFAVLLLPLCLCLGARKAASGKAAFMHGWLTGIFGISASLYWIYIPVTETGGLPALAGMACVFLLSALLALYTGLFCLLVRALARLFTCPSATREPALAALLLFPLLCGAVYGGVEVLCWSSFTGLPWHQLTLAFVPGLVGAQAASLMGGHALSALYAAGACFAASALRPAGNERIPAAVAALLIPAAIFLYGTERLKTPPSATGPEIPVFLVQGNINQNQKWDPAYQETSTAKYTAMTEAALRKHGDAGKIRPFVLWPETAMPFFYNRNITFADKMRNFAAKENVNLGFGVLAGMPEKDGRPAMRNRLQLISSAGTDVGHYDKEHLVPFGEYIPLPFDLPFLQVFLQGLYFTPGASQPPMRLPLLSEQADLLADAYIPPMVNGQPQAVNAQNTPAAPQGPTVALGGLICYEVLFPDLAQKRVEDGAEIFVSISNDAWFGKSSAPRQHLYFAALRSIEQARSMVRSTNTGVSAIIDSRGGMGRTTDLFTDIVLDGTVRPSSEKTTYHKLYPLPEITLVLFAFAAMCLAGATFFRERRARAAARTQ